MSVLFSEIDPILLATPLAVSLLFGLGGLYMRAPDTVYQKSAGVCFAFDGIWLGVVSFMWLIHTPNPLQLRIAAGLIVGAIVFVAIPLLIRQTWPPQTDVRAPPSVDTSTPPENKLGDLNNNTGIVTQGQSGDNEIKK